MRARSMVVRSGILGLVLLWGAGQAQAKSTGFSDSVEGTGFGLRLAMRPRMSLDMQAMPGVGSLVKEVQERTRELLAYELDTSVLNATIPAGWQLVPSLHFGGDGYAARIEFPLELSSKLWSAGLGVYPLGYGYFIEAVHAMPYVFVGGSLSYLQHTATFPSWMNLAPADGPPEEVTQEGILVQARVLVGVRYFGHPEFPVSLELAWIPYVAGVLINSEHLGRYSEGDASRIRSNHPASAVRGGVADAHYFSFSMGVEWI